MGDMQMRVSDLDLNSLPFRLFSVPSVTPWCEGPLPSRERRLAVALGLVGGGVVVGGDVGI